MTAGRASGTPGSAGAQAPTGGQGLQQGGGSHHIPPPIFSDNGDNGGLSDICAVTGIANVGKPAYHIGSGADHTLSEGGNARGRQTSGDSCNGTGFVELHFGPAL